MTRLWTVGEFATARMCSPSAPAMPLGRSSLAIAAGVSSTSNCLNAGSTQARATTFAPLNGPIWVSKNESTVFTVLPVMTPFSISNDSSARARAALLASRSAGYSKRCACAAAGSIASAPIPGTAAAADAASSILRRLTRERPGNPGVGNSGVPASLPTSDVCSSDVFGRVVMELILSLRAIGPLRQVAGTNLRHSASVGLVEIRFEQVGIDRDVLVGVPLPDFFRVKAHAVDRHGVANSVGSGRREVGVCRRIDRIDGADPVAQIAGEARMLDARHVFHEHLVAYRKARLRGAVAFG